LRADEVPLLLAHVPERHRALFATAIWTGMRKGELIGLRKSDVDLEHEVILVARSSHDPTHPCGGILGVIPCQDEVETS
jgi:integrase